MESNVRVCAALKWPENYSWKSRRGQWTRTPVPHSWRREWFSWCAFTWRTIVAKFHPDPIWNDEALGFFPRGHPNKNNNKNKTSSDMRSVLETECIYTIFGDYFRCCHFFSTKCGPKSFLIWTCPQKFRGHLNVDIHLTKSGFIAHPEPKIQGPFKDLNLQFSSTKVIDKKWYLYPRCDASKFRPWHWIFVK